MSSAPANVVATPMPRPAVRAVVSLIAALHVIAVFVGPWAMPQTSDLGAKFGRAFQPYLDALSLGNGYRFFAPEPGPSHLVRFEVTTSDGTLQEGFFPNRAEHWPRLLYHRYFMLSEFVNTLGAAPDTKLADAYARGYARHLADELDGRTVKLYLRRHYVPRSEEVRSGRRLDDKILYEERLIHTYERD